MEKLPDLVFMGTPDFARVSLGLLLDRGFPVKAVVTQPDRPQGRRNVIVPPPVKTLALQHGIPVLQPEHLPDIQGELQEFQPEFVVVVAYGQILDDDMLCLPCRMCKVGSQKACINAHASLLPLYRGASPIQSAIWNGDAQTGVTTMLLESGMDTGAMLLQDTVPILDDDTFETLHDKLALAGADLLAKTLLTFDEITPRPQDHDKATYTEKFTKQHGCMEWSRTALEIHNQVRACTPWPAAYTFHNGNRLIVWETLALDGEERAAEPGTVLRVDAHGIVVATRRGTLCIKQLQRQGKKRMAFDALLRGYAIEAGDRFGV